MPADASRLRQSLRQWGPAVLTDAARETARLAAQDPKTPRGSEPHPGPRIVDAFTASPASGVPVAKATVANTAPQSLYTDKGTRPHGPRTARVLRFTVGGQVIFTPRVRGIAPQRWWRPVLERSFPPALRTAARRTPLR